MRRRLVRLFAIVLLMGQVAQISGGALCALQGRSQAVHCEAGMAQPAGPSVTASMDGMASAFCHVMGPCGAPVSAVTTAPIVNDIVLAEAQLAAVAAAMRPASFRAAPIPPPPQV